jgi:hypothetical protein
LWIARLLAVSVLLTVSGLVAIGRRLLVAGAGLAETRLRISYGLSEPRRLDLIRIAAGSVRLAWQC